MIHYVLSYLKFEIFAVLGCYAAYQYTLRNIPEERRSHFQRGGRLKSRTSEVHILPLLLMVGSVGDQSQATSAAE